VELNTLDCFFYPSNIAVVGASDDPGKAGYQITSNLLALGFAGSIYPVNPQKPMVAGRKCYPDVKSIPGPVDLVIITAPAFEVLSILKNAAERQDIRAAVIIASGFSETKIPERVQLERDVIAVAKQAGIRLMGPNCVGVINTENSLDTTFAAEVRQVPGNWSVISQSGALGAALMMWSTNWTVPMGFNKWAHVGNQADVNLLEVLRYYAQDQGTRVIAMYMEGIGDGKAFLQVAKEITRTKPILALKVGRSDAGSGAAASHTGSIVGADEVYDAAFQQVGILRVDSIEDLLDSARSLSTQPLPKGNRVAVLTEAGGPGIIAVDELGRYPDVQMAQLSAETKQRLKAVLPPMALIDFAPGYVDMSAAAMEKHHAAALACVLDDPGVDGVVLITVPPSFLQPTPLSQAILDVLKVKKDKPVTVCIMGGPAVRGGLSLLERNQQPTYELPDRAAKAMVRMVQRSAYLQRLAAEVPAEAVTITRQEEFAVARAEGRHLLEPEAQAVLQRFGVPFAPSAWVNTPEEAVKFASTVNGPVVLKIVSPQILHKSDAGGVRLNLVGEPAIRQAYADIVASARKYDPQAQIKGMLVAVQAEPGVEVIIGAKRDAQFGPVLMFGLGGIFVELFKDVVFRVAPITRKEALEMIRSVKGYKLLAGYRGRPAADLESLASTLVAVGRLLLSCPDVAELDLNPMVVNERGAVSLDARIILAEQAAAAAR
jgi:acetyltransferase